MATANEILSYNPQPDLAFGSTSLPAFSNAAVWDTTPAVQFWAQHSQNKLNTAKALRDELAAKQLKEQEQVAKALDQGQYKIWDADRAAFNPKWDEFREEVIDVVNRGAWNDINDEGFIRVQKMQGDLDQFAQFSTQQQKHYEVGENDYRTNPAKWRNGQEQLAQYKAVGDPYKRADTDYNLQPEGGWDVSAMMKELVEGVARENPDAVTATPDRFGNVVYSFPVEIDRALLNERINAGLDATRSGINGYEYEFSIEPDNVKAFYASAPDPARAWAYDMALAAANLDLEAKNSIHQINYAPGSTTAATVPQFEYVTDIPVSAFIGAKNLKPRKRADGLYEVTDISGDVQTLSTIGGDPITTFTDAKEANEAISRAAGAIAISPIGGWNFSGLGEYPANININPPQSGYDLLKNRKLTEGDRGTDVWTVDVISVFDWYRNKSNGALADKGQVNEKNRGNYDVVRLARVKKAVKDGDDATYEIPYADNIRIPLENALRKAKIPESDFPSNVPLGGLGGVTNAPQAQSKGGTPKTYTFTSEAEAGKQSYNDGDVINIGTKQYTVINGTITRVK